MNTIKSINIQSPCHESWEGMTLDAAGRFCQSCNKTVTDFSRMTDDEVIGYLSNHRNICGRIGTSQLAQVNNKLAANTLSAKPIWRHLWVAAGLFLTASYAKATPVNKPSTVQTEYRKMPADTNQTRLMGKIAAPVPVFNIIKGVIVDEQDSIIAGATIKSMTGNTGAITNSKGEFTLRIPATEKELTVSSIGYQTKIVKIKKLTGNTIRLKLNTMMLGGLGAVKMPFHQIAYKHIIETVKNILG